jgi:hypothetical protein
VSHKPGRNGDDKLLAPTPAAWKPNVDRTNSDGVYSSIRNSNPFTDSGPAFFGQIHQLKEHTPCESEASSMAQRSAIPQPLFDQKNNAHKLHRGSLEGSSFVRTVNEAKARAPSYEGNGYEGDITPSFVKRKMHAAAEYEIRPDQRSPVPEPVHPIDEKGVAYRIPQALPWPGQTPQFQPRNNAAWPDESDGDQIPSPPPVPAKNPQRYNSVHDLHSAEGSRHISLQPPVYHTLGPRIISVENIRAHLTVSPQTSHENLKKMEENREKRMLPSLPFREYDSQTFPRQEQKYTLLNKSDTSRYGADGEYELEILGQGEKK